MARGFGRGWKMPTLQQTALIVGVGTFAFLAYAFIAPRMITPSPPAPAPASVAPGPVSTPRLMTPGPAEAGMIPPGNIVSGYTHLRGYQGRLLPYGRRRINVT